ncbi:MAG: YdbL family protein [Cephaloticoccus sp.]|nr:YdbL family protein [Cephaloticoccus sp.]MCF7759780.1 YdbL family protein [Cephaloticoccus sp.]
MNPNFTRLLLAIFLMFFAATLTRAEDLNTVRARMEQRIGQLDNLKMSGAIGENNRGLVEVRAAAGDAASVVAAENADRETVYAELARKTGTSADQVGRARARQIAANSANGVWLQDDGGKWYQK